MCVSSASTGLCGGCRETGIPTATAGPLDPLFADEISCTQTKQADEGVGCGPGGPPHQECLSPPASPPAVQ